MHCSTSFWSFAKQQVFAFRKEEIFCTWIHSIWTDQSKLQLSLLETLDSTKFCHFVKLLNILWGVSALFLLDFSLTIITRRKEKAFNYDESRVKAECVIQLCPRGGMVMIILDIYILLIFNVAYYWSSSKQRNGVKWRWANVSDNCVPRLGMAGRGNKG